MKKIYLFVWLFFHALYANQYDYLLFSNIVSDVQSGFDLKADVNARWQDNTPIYMAVKNNNLEIVYLLIMAGADVNAISYGETPLHLAVRNKNAYIAQLLITAGAKVNTKDEAQGNTPLHYAALNSDRQILSMLTNAGGDMNAVNLNGMTPAQAVLAEIVIPPLILEDNNIAISASAFKVTQSAVTFNIRNLTNEPLTIFHTGLYVNGQLIASARKPLIIPPGTIITNINTMPIGNTAMYVLQADKNGQISIKAGFSVDYQAEGRMEQVFNSREMRLQLWNPPPKKQTKPRDLQDSKEIGK